MAIGARFVGYELRARPKMLQPTGPYFPPASVRQVVGVVVGGAVVVGVVVGKYGVVVGLWKSIKIRTVESAKTNTH